MTSISTREERQQTAEQRRSLLWQIYATILSDPGRAAERDEGEKVDEGGAAASHVSGQIPESAQVSNHTAPLAHASAPAKP